MDEFALSASTSGGASLVGAYGVDGHTGAAYLFREGEVLELGRSGVVGAGDIFGFSVSLAGQAGLVGAWGVGGNTGAAYYYNNLGAPGGHEVESARLLVSDGQALDMFGVSSSLSGASALVGAWGVGVLEGGANYGAAYYYRNLGSASGDVVEDLVLHASDRAEDAYFGASVSLTGAAALVGADGAGGVGAAYYYRDLDAVVGSTATEDTRLYASDGAEGDGFGFSVSLTGETALVGAHSYDGHGAAFYYRGLGSAGSSAAENVRLEASDATEGQGFGSAVSLSGETALVGAPGEGGVYLYQNLGEAGAVATESVKLFASHPLGGDAFGSSVSLDGDTFLIGAPGDNGSVGKAYTGSVSSVTTLDVGNTSRVISGISFASREDWVVGATSSNNSVTLSEGDTAEVLGVGKVVTIGREAGSNGNTLVIEGDLTANEVLVGAADNSGNRLLLAGSVTAEAVRVAAGSAIGGGGLLVGDLTLEAGANFEFTLGQTLTVTGVVSLDSSFGVASLLGFTSGVANGTYTLIEGELASLNIQNFGLENAYDLGGGRLAYFKQGSLQLEVIPEPGSVLLLLGGAAALAVLRRRTVR